MRRNDQTNRLIMWAVVLSDFVLLNSILVMYKVLHFGNMPCTSCRQFFIISNIALLISELKFHAEIHERYAAAGDVLKRIIELTVAQVFVAYLLMRHVMYWMASGTALLWTGSFFLVLMVIMRLVERNAIKSLRRSGRNTRTVRLVGADSELRRIYQELVNNPTTGYRIQGYYADEKIGVAGIPWLGTVKHLVEQIVNGEEVVLGDEMYACLSSKEGETIRLLSKECDKQVTKFFYVPLSVECIGLNFKREYINDIEVFATHESPLEDTLNKFIKRVFDIVLSSLFMLITAFIYPIVWIMIKIQSPGPIFFRQERTGLDGKNYMMVKFRSMHVNDEADTLQATKDDPRKFPFGDFMRRTNIDELPQFWNVLMGSMSIVGPRPHMIAHTEMYSKLIDQYMVRHFVKPGVTGWAQVTGYRGETRELWQMEERVKRDIWYMENWSIWLDIRIIWLTIKTIFIHDKNAY